MGSHRDNGVPRALPQPSGRPLGGVHTNGVEDTGRGDGHCFPRNIAGAPLGKYFLCHMVAVMRIQGDKKVRVMGTGEGALFPRKR